MEKKQNKYIQKEKDLQTFNFLVKKYNLAELIKQQHTFVYILNSYRKQTILCCPKSEKNLVECSRILSYNDAKTFKTLLLNLRKISTIGVVMQSTKPSVFYVNNNNNAKGMKISFDNENNIKISNHNMVEHQQFNIGLFPINCEYELEA